MSFDKAKVERFKGFLESNKIDYYYVSYQRTTQGLRLQVINKKGETLPYTRSHGVGKHIDNGKRRWHHSKYDTILQNDTFKSDMKVDPSRVWVWLENATLEEIAFSEQEPTRASGSNEEEAMSSLMHFVTDKKLLVFPNKNEEVVATFRA